MRRDHWYFISVNRITTANEINRAAQFLGGAYMLVAAVASVREAHDGIILLEETLHRHPDFVAEVLKTVGWLVIVRDREGRIVSFNRACEETSGYSSSRCLAKAGITLPCFSGNTRAEQLGKNSHAVFGDCDLKRFSLFLYAGSFCMIIL